MDPALSLRDLAGRRHANSYAALRDESYGIIQRAVDDMLKDRELREKIEYYARQILKAIAAKL